MPGVHALPPAIDAGAAGTVSLADDTVRGASYAFWQLGADGFIYKNDQPSYAWLNPRVGMGDYEIRATVVLDVEEGGTEDLDISSPLGVWLSAATSPKWGFRGSGSSEGGDLTVTVRLAATGEELDSAVIRIDKGGTTTSTGGGGGGDDDIGFIGRVAYN